jgi:hypothetical protein
MRPDERFPDLQHLFKVANDALAAGLWVALPGTVAGTGNLASQQTIEVQPTIQGIQTSKTLVSTFVDLPELPDVPVIFPGGGDYVATFPIQTGDECLVVFSSRNIDNWWQSSGVQPPMDQRSHDLSDGFALVGPRSKPKAITAFSTTTMQLRSLDATVMVELDQPNGMVNIVAPVSINCKTPLVNITGVINVEGTSAEGNVATIGGALHATGIISSASDVQTTQASTGAMISLGAHGHNGVAIGDDNTGIPVVL